MPSHLPTRIQVGGAAYVFVGVESPDEAGTLTATGCVGAFELVRTDQADPADVVYLRAVVAGAASAQVYRFEVAVTFEVEFEVTERPQTITALDERYRLEQLLEPELYSSTSVILFADDQSEAVPSVLYGLNVSQTVVGDSIGEYRLASETAAPDDELTLAARQAGLNPDLTVNGLVYVLVDVYTPTGTTRNGFMTLFATGSDEVPARLLGRDKREQELYVFVLETPTTG